MSPSQAGAEWCFAAYLLFDLSFEVALVLGAVLVVSGPTVVGPLLDFIRPSKTVNSVLMWEGTLADPIGATLGVVVFSAVVAGHAKAGQEILQFLLAIVIGAGFGVARAVLILAWVRWFEPNPSQALSGALMFVFAMVVGADLLRDDTGLITGLVIGAILVNRPPGGSVPIEDFLDASPTKVAASLLVLEIVRAAPPPAFSGGGKWEGMHGRMGGYYEIRSTGPGREHFRLFCRLENGTEAELFERFASR